MFKKKGDGYITVLQILKNLTHIGFDNVSSRTVERDLHALSLDFAITCDSSAKPYKYCGIEISVTIESPSMGRNIALTLKLAQQHLEPLLPNSSIKYLNSKFNQANLIYLSTLSGRIH